MKPSDGKIAIFVCGPVRYTLYVSRMIDRIFQGYDYDCFYHIWKKDLGNKVRAGEVEDLEEVQNHPRTKVLIRQEPYRPEDFADAIGTQTGSNSSINATMGMFCSVNLLCHYLEQLPDFSAYRYILRLRTDCAIFNPQFPSLLNPSNQTLTFAKSYFIPDDAVCDHMCFGTVPSFFAIWRFANMEEIYRAYLEAKRNPEALLRCRLQKRPQIRVWEGPVRFRDYHIVYVPTRDCDPASINSVLNEKGIELFFEKGGKFIDPQEIERFNEKWKQHWAEKKTAQPDQPRFSFVMIVLNGMPFLEYSLKSVYDFAHEIIVVEGAVEKCMFAANPDGSSKDGTVEFLKAFPDPAHKIRLIQGRWPEKCEMQNEALRYVTGDYVWLIDSDEVYKREDLEKIRIILKKDPSITQVNFIPDNFWKGLDYIFVSKKFFEAAHHYRRLFKYKPGAVFTSHRPPTLRWPGCEQTTEQMRLLDGLATRRLGIIPFHYSYVLDSQVRQKIELYRRYGWGRMWNLDLEEWYQQCFQKWTPAHREEIEKQWPVWTGDRQSHTEPFTGTHPEVMREFRMPEKTSSSPSIGFPEDRSLPVIGSPSVQSTVLEAWREVETDAPIQKRIAYMQQQIAAGKPFWNLHTALAYTANVLRPRSYLEIGVRTGCSMVQVLAHSDPQEVVGIDLWTGCYADLPNTKELTEKQIKRFLQKTGRTASLRLIQGNSHQILKRLIADGCRFDLITVDGDHSEAGAWEDLQDARLLLAERGAIVFDDIRHPDFPFLMETARRFAQSYPEFKMLMNSVQDNGCVIYLKGIEPEQFLGLAPDQGQRQGRLKVAEEYVKNGMVVSDDSAFSEAIRRIVQQVRPQKIIETGTYLGRGTTAILAEALRVAGLKATFFTIEVNPKYHAQARAYLESKGYSVKPLCGLSIPRRLLPDREQISFSLLQVAGEESIFVDHPDSVRAERYYQETDFPNVPDDLLGRCLEAFDGRPDFVLLDSAGHLGWIEFQYLLERLKGPCILALDDIYHVKHYRSFQRMQKDKRFEILTVSKEKFGFCIARFDPQRTVQTAAKLLAEPQHILWLRPDAIGDGVLSSAMLPIIRRRFSGSRLTVLVQESTAPLYEYCPFVDQTLHFSEQQMWHDPQFIPKWAQTIRSLGVDCILYSVYSRNWLMDNLVSACQVRWRIGMEGDCCNIRPEQKARSDQWYTHLIASPGTWKPELERHRDFLKGLGCPDEPLEPTLWLGEADETFARRWFEENQVSPAQTVVLFAGARTFHRLYEGYGQALEKTVVARGWTVLSLGGREDFEINRQNLEQLRQKGVRTLNLCGKLSLRQTAALMKQCRLAVGAETGLAHIAAALGVPHVIVIGGGHFGRFMPYSPKTTLAALPLDCYGCNWNCRYGQEKIYCIRKLEPFVLAEAIEQTVQKTSSRPRIFVQDKSCYNQGEKGPAWKRFDLWMDTQKVELFTVSLKSTHTRPTEKKGAAMPSEPIQFSILENPDEFTYSKKGHFALLQSAALELYGHPVDPAVCDLKRYQDLLVFEFIKRHVPKGSRILEVGGGDSRILNYFWRDYECWNIDPLDGSGNGLRQLDPGGRYKLVQDFMGKFSPELPNDYFDFVFSISTLENTGEDAQSMDNIQKDIHRVLKPGGYSFHLFDCVIKPDQVWIHRLLPSLFFSQTMANRWVEPEKLMADPDLYTMTKAAYEGFWMPVTREPYESFGKPFSYQALWQKAPASGPARTVSVRSTELPKITVVTPSYNQAPYLEACIQSVLNQGYPNLEYIIMDGGSTDGSVEIIKKYEKYLAYWQSKPDGGQYKAVEEGFARSTGQIMTWLNSDDMFFPDAFEIAAAVFSERPDIEWLTGRVVNFNEDGTIKLIREDIPLWCRAKYLKKDYRSPYLQQEGTFWRRSLWQKAGGCMRTDLHLAGDLELWTRFFRHADLHTLDAVLAGYRLQPNRKIATLLERYHQEADRILEDELKEYLNQPTRPPLKTPPPYVSALQLCRYRAAFRKTYGIPSGREPMALATSLAPGNFDNQQKAVQSWLKAGFLVLSVNTPEEIGRLRLHFPQVHFVGAARTGQEDFGKPMIYIDDLLGALKDTQIEMVGLINSDIHLSLEPVHLDEIVRRTQEAVICVNRLNVKQMDSRDGVLFVGGFDVFFFRRWMLERIPPSRFCLGIAWWDYYIPIVCVLNQIPMVCFQEPIAWHIRHPLNWDKIQWTKAARYFFERLLELCGQRKGYNPLINLGPKFREAWKLFHLILLNDCPTAIIHKGYIYAEFIMGIVCGQMKILEPLCPDRLEKNPFFLPDPKTITHGLMTPSMTLIGEDKSAGPLVSAIVSTYESEAFIGGCLQDLVEQTLYQKGLMEIIVVDSASPQNEGAIVRDFQSRYPNIRYIRSLQRETLYAAWNRGIREARGKYITNANTDDRHAPQMLEMLAAALEENPEKAAAYSHFYMTEIPNQTWENKKEVRLVNWHPPFSREALLKGNFMGPQPMWRRSLHEEYGYFDPTLRVSGDWEFFLRVSQTHSFIRCPLPLGLYYLNPKSLERSAGTREKEDRFIRDLYAKNWNKIIRRPFDPQTDCAFPEPVDSFPREPMVQNPLISVCLVAYNTEPYIGRAIESILAQTYSNFELLIVDDGSTDRTGQIALSFQDPRIRYIRQDHKNFAAGMNRAIQEARGEFVIGVDSDDQIEADYLSRMVDFAARHPDADYYFPEKLTLLDASGKPTGVEWAYEEVSDSSCLPALLFARGNSPIPNSGSLKRRSMFEKTGFYRELDNVEDFDFLCRCGPQIRFRRVQGSSRYFYRRLEKSNTARFEQRHHITARCLEEMLERYQPEQLAPFLTAKDPFEWQKQFWDYVVSIFEKHMQTYHGRGGEIFERCVVKYQQKRSVILVQEGFKSIQQYLEKGNKQQAARICRQLLSDNFVSLTDESRQTLERILAQIERMPEKELVSKL